MIISTGWPPTAQVPAVSRQTTLPVAEVPQWLIGLPSGVTIPVVLAMSISVPVGEPDAKVGEPGALLRVTKTPLIS
jgi:hypothetical protein